MRHVNRGIECQRQPITASFDLPDATTLILEGLLFTNLLAWEALNGRITPGRIALAAQGAAQKESLGMADLHLTTFTGVAGRRGACRYASFLFASLESA